jgi:hypothetical protein
MPERDLVPVPDAGEASPRPAMDSPMLDSAPNALAVRPVNAMDVPKHHVVRLLREAGLPGVADEAERVLPDPVEYDRAESFLAQHGITKDGLISWRGGSP